MEWTPVVSSNVAAIRHDADKQLLAVEFNNATVYHYFGVPRRHFDGLLNAPSVGKYLNAHIKGVYDYQQVK